MKDDKQKTIIMLLTILVCIHTFAFFGGYFLFKNKFRELTKIVISNMKRIDLGQPAAPSEQVVDINIPLYQYLGDENAAVEMVIITDFECSFCIKFTNEIFPEINDDFIDNGLVKISYLPYPLEQLHSNALNAAITASYANENNLFWPAHHFLFENTESLNDQLMIDYVESLGLDGEELSKRFKSKNEIEQIRNTSEYLINIGVTGTPTIVVNDKLLNGFRDYNTLSSILNQELKESTRKISNDEAAIIATTTDTVFLDVRTSEEFQDGNIDGSINVDIKQSGEFLTSIQKMDKNSSYIVYCKSGFRSTRAYIEMEKAGFTTLYNLSDGYDGWNN